MKTAEAELILRADPLMSECIHVLHASLPPTCHPLLVIHLLNFACSSASPLAIVIISASAIQLTRHPTHSSARLPAHSFTCLQPWFAQSFAHVPNHPLIWPLVHLLAYPPLTSLSPARSSVWSHIHAFARLPVHPVFHIFTCLLVCLLVHTLMHPAADLPAHSPVHRLVSAPFCFPIHLPTH